MGGRSVPRRVLARRAALLVAVAAALAVLAALVVTDPRRIGLFLSQPGRSAAPGEASWVRLADAPIALTEVAAAVHDGRIWVAGGLDESGRAVASLLAAAGWRGLTTLSEPREHLAAASTSPGRVTFLGGRAGANLGIVDLVASDGRVERLPDLPTPRGGIAAFAADGLGACVVGGESAEGTFAAVECISAAGATSLPGLGVARHGLGAVAADGRAFVLLGGPRPGLTVSAVVEALDLSP